MNIKRIDNFIYEMRKHDKMNVPARIFASETIFKNIEEEAFKQLKNCASLPGVYKYVFGMPDIVIGRNGKVSAIIEAKKQTTFRVDETDKFKLAYFASKGHNVILVSTASPPKRSHIFEELVHKGVIIAFVRSYGDLLKLSREISVG